MNGDIFAQMGSLAGSIAFAAVLVLAIAALLASVFKKD